MLSLKINQILDEIKKFFSVPKNLVFMVAGPLFFTLLFGYVYSSDYLNHVPTAVLDMDQSGLSRTIIQEFEDNEKYDVVYYVEDRMTLEEMIRDKKAMAGLLIPPDFEKDIKGKKGATAALIIDGTNIAIGNNAVAAGSEILNTVNAGITIGFLEGKNVPPRLSNNYAQFFKINTRTFWDEKLTYKTYMLPGMILVLVQQLFLSVFVVNFIQDKENLFAKAQIHLLVGTLAYFLCLLTIKNVLNITVNGNMLIATLLVYVYLCCLTGIAITIGALTRDSLKATQFCMMMSLPSFITAGYVWPAFRMPVFVTGFSKALWPLIYMISPLRDFVIKGVLPTGAQSTFIGLLVFGIVWLFIGLKLTRKLSEA